MWSEGEVKVSSRNSSAFRSTIRRWILVGAIWVGVNLSWTHSDILGSVIPSMDDARGGRNKIPEAMSVRYFSSWLGGQSASSFSPSRGRVSIKVDQLSQSLWFLGCYCSNHHASIDVTDEHDFWENSTLITSLTWVSSEIRLSSCERWELAPSPVSVGVDIMSCSSQQWYYETPAPATVSCAMN